MIGLFPEPYDDELLYSVCGRYYDRMQYPNKAAVARELLGSVQAKAVIDLPWHLDRLIAVLPPGNHYSLKRLIEEHTLFPLYSPFLTQVVKNDLFQMMRFSKGSGFYQHFGLLMTGVSFPQKLRFCPVCVKDERQQLGECYWHRLHQVPGVEVCPTHEVFLVNSDVSAYRHFPCYEFVSAHRGTKAIAPTFVNLTASKHSILLQIARDAAWLLQYPDSSRCLESTHSRYEYLIASRFQVDGLGKDPKNILDRLLTLIVQYYSDELLKQLHCSLESHNSRNWLKRLLMSFELCHPLHHLLLIQFLGITVEEFFQLPIFNPTKRLPVLLQRKRQVRR